MLLRSELCIVQPFSLSIFFSPKMGPRVCARAPSHLGMCTQCLLSLPSAAKCPRRNIIENECEKRKGGCTKEIPPLAGRGRLLWHLSLFVPLIYMHRMN